MIFIEGNIAAGKTTLGHTLAKANPGLTFWEEPVADWREWGILEAYYQDPKRWALTMQIAALNGRMRLFRKAMGETHGITGREQSNRLILERSVLTDRHIFAELNRRLGNINAMEWLVYTSIRQPLDEAIMADARIIYLRTTAEVCLERIIKRGREEEQNISLEYLRQLEQMHDEWLLDRGRTYILDIRRGSPEEAAAMCTTWLENKL